MDVRKMAYEAAPEPEEVILAEAGPPLNTVADVLTFAREKVTV
ncbi:MAG: hypothetical protein ABF979_13785 [Gluconobacter sp.]